MRGVATLLLVCAGSAAALRLPSAVKGGHGAPSSRREFGSVAASAAVSLLALPRGTSAYDSLPTVDADFAKIEKARMEREMAARKKSVEVFKYVEAIEASSQKTDFISACDKFSIYVIGEQKFPEGLNVKAMVKRITVAYDALPKERYYCEATRTNQGVCYTPGKDAEGAYEALVKEIRQYSLITLGDYRTVQFKAF